MKNKEYRISILEKHHSLKKDSPSGTALKIADDINKKLNDNPPIESKRLGKLKGEHMVCYRSTIDEIQIPHSSTTHFWTRWAIDRAIVGPSAVLFHLSQV